jgi:hypothetical protein
MRRKFHKFVVMFAVPSSWRGVVVILTGLGSALKPEHAEAIVSGGLIIAGAISIWLEP